MKQKISVGVFTFIAILAVSGCTTVNNGNSYSASEAKSVQQVYYGKIQSLETVTIEASETANVIGSIAGAVAGGILGSKVGGGSGSDLAALGGGLLGGYAGGKAASALGQKNGVNITIQLDGGKVISTVQEINASSRFEIGQRVQVNMKGQKATVVPA